MKVRLPLIVTVFVLSCCAPDFNPETDSNMCPMTFTFETENLFETVLSYKDGEFRKGGVSDIPSGFELRITSFCYDSNGKLLRTDDLRSESLASLELKVPYIFSTEEYHFVFVADFVKDGSPYWYPLQMSSASTAYLRRSNNEPPLETMFAFSGQWYGKAIPEPVAIDLAPATYNCFCVLGNLENIVKVDTEFGYSNSIHLSGTFERQTYVHDKTYSLPERQIVIPMVLPVEDESINIIVSRKYFSDNDSLKGNLANPDRIPFVLNVDVTTLDYEIDWYE